VYHGVAAYQKDGLHGDLQTPQSDLLEAPQAGLLVAHVPGKGVVDFGRQVVHQAGVEDGPAAVKVHGSLDDAAVDRDECLSRVDIADDGADERVVDVGEVAGEERDGGFDVVEVDAQVHDEEALVFFQSGLELRVR